MAQQNTAVLFGLAKITGAVVIVSVIISLVSGYFGHWMAVIPGLGIGWLAVASIHGK